MLIKRPDVDHRLRLELSSLGKSYSSTDLANLPYLDGVIRETLRVYPPAPAPMPRVVPKSGFEFEGVSYPPDVKLPNSAWQIPVHSNLDRAQSQLTCPNRPSSQLSPTPYIITRECSKTRMNSGLSAGSTYRPKRRTGCTGLLSHSQLVKEGKSSHVPSQRKDEKIND